MSVWTTKTFADICLSIEDGDWIEKKDQADEGIRLIQTGNVGIGVYKDKADKAKYISQDTFRRLKCLEVVEGDILISRLPEPVGRACVVPQLPTRCITAVDCSILKLGAEVLMKWFIYYTQSSEYFKKAKAECSGTTRDRITRKKLSVITIPVPPLTEQQRIVDVLDAEFEKIDAVKNNAERNFQNAKNFYQSVLKKELEPKDGWKSFRLYELGATATGTTPKTSDKGNYGDYMPFIKPADINTDGRGGIRYDNEGLSEIGAKNARVFPASSVLMVCIGATIGKVGFSTQVVSSNQQINVLSPYEKESGKFLYYCMASPSFQHSVISEGESAKATLPIINKSKWENLTVSIPNLTEQQIIVAHLDNLSDRCKALQENYEKTTTLCDDLKQALLRKAFNGEL